MNGATQGCGEDGGLTLAIVSEGRCKRQFAFVSAVTEEGAVAAANRIPAVANHVVRCKATEADASAGDGLGASGNKRFWRCRRAGSFKVRFRASGRVLVLLQQLTSLQ